MADEQSVCIALAVAAILLTLYLLQFIKDQRILVQAGPAGVAAGPAVAGPELADASAEHFMNEIEPMRTAGGDKMALHTKRVPRDGNVGPSDLASQLYGVSEISAPGI